MVLEPVKQTGTEAALVLIQDLQILPEQYFPLARAVQNASNLTLWVGIPQFSLNTATEFDIGRGVERILGSLKEAGFKGKVAFAGHSLGGASLQRYLADNPSLSRAQVLLGSFLLREY